MAISAGAEFIEKHITLDRRKKGFDYYSALNPDEFRNFVKYIRNASLSFKNKVVSEMGISEKQYRRDMKKFAVLKEDVIKNTELNIEKLEFKRVNKKGLTKSEFTNLKVKYLKHNISKGTILNEKFFQK